MSRQGLRAGFKLEWLALALVAWSVPFVSCDTRGSPITRIDYPVEGPYMMNMSETREIPFILRINKDLLPYKGVESMKIFFQTKTLSPQFSILSLDPKSRTVELTRKQLESTGFSPEIKLRLNADYIGHSIVKPTSIEYRDLNNTKYDLLVDNQNIDLHVTIVQNVGRQGTLFFVSVSAFIIITYINLGAQLDTENIKQIMEKPKILALGFIIQVIVMPAISWATGLWFLRNQVFYRIGSYVFACSPAASASTLWTVMLGSDKELSVGLQVTSTLGSLATMPLLLYYMEMALQQEGTAIGYPLVVPYGRLLQTLLVLTFALFIGWRFVGRNSKAQRISRKIFRPLTFFVLIYIIVFSSVLYWHIYRMFDWNITMNSLVITLATYCVTSLLGYLISGNIEQAVAISVSSAYRNSGIAFAMLFVAFGTPDTYIAYVPCLTQVVITSISLYLVYCLLNLVSCIRRRNQPKPIQATTEEEADQPATKPRVTRSGSDGANRSEEGEEFGFVAISVTDEKPGSPSSTKAAKLEEQIT